MNVKNIKISFLVFILIIIFIIIGLILFNKSNNNKINNKINNNINFENDVNLYNKILKKSRSIDDIKKCEQLKNKDIKDECVLSIKQKFGDMAQAKTLEDCNILKATKNENKEFRIDVCKYNIIIKMNKKEIDFNKMCGKIVNKDIKNSCLANFQK